MVIEHDCLAQVSDALRQHYYASEAAAGTIGAVAMPLLQTLTQEVTFTNLWLWLVARSVYLTGGNPASDGDRGVGSGRPAGEPAGWSGEQAPRRDANLECSETHPECREAHL